MLHAAPRCDSAVAPDFTWRPPARLDGHEHGAISTRGDTSDCGIPGQGNRFETLRAWAVQRFGPDRGPRADTRFLELLSNHYPMLMDDQVDTNRYSRTEVILERHAALGVDSALVNYYRGEMYRQRAAEGDSILARDAYLASIATGRAVPEAYRNLGYLYLRAGDTAAARENFRKYLESAPAADDRAMIEFYLADEGAP